MNIKQLLYYFIALIAICSCDLLPDPDYPKEGYLNYMPEETQIGANTFGCYINGKLTAVQGTYKQQLSFGWVNGYWSKSQDKRIMNIEINANPNAFMIFRSEGLRLGMNRFGIYYIDYGMSEELVGKDSVNINITKIDENENIMCGRFDSITFHTLGEKTLNEIDTIWTFGIDTLVIYKTEIIDSLITLTNGRFDIKYGKNFYP